MHLGRRDFRSQESRLGGALGVVRALLGVGLFAAVGVAVARSWTDVHQALGRMSAIDVGAAEALVLIGLLASVLTWRAALRQLSSDVALSTAARIYLLGQLGKYLPGSVWAFAAQMDLAGRVGIPRVRALAAGIVAVGINLATGLAVGLFILPSVTTGGHWRVVAMVVLLAVAVVALSPPVLGRLVSLGLRLIRRPPLERKLRWRDLLAGAGWSTGSWVAYGSSVWILAVAAGAPAGASWFPSFAGVALAMTAGSLVVVVPSGIGVREAVIVAALTPVLDHPGALAVALVARLTFTAADLIAALAVIAAGQHKAAGSTRRSLERLPL